MAVTAVDDLQVLEVPSTSFLGGLLPDDRLALQRAGRARRLDVGERAMVQGQVGDDVVLIRSGVLRIAASSSDGVEVTLNIRTSGDVIGELGALASATEPRSASAIAVTPARIVVVRGLRFRELLLTRPTLSSAVLTALAGRMREATRRHLEFGAYPIEQRLARLVLELSSNEDGGLPSHLSQEDLAGMIGASRESVVRALGRLRRDGVVVTARRSLVILDRLALEQVAGLRT